MTVSSRRTYLCRAIVADRRNNSTSRWLIHLPECLQHVVICLYVFFFTALQPNSSLGRLTIDISRSHAKRYTQTNTVGLLWTSDRVVAGTATCTTQNKRKRRKSMPSAANRTRDSSNRVTPDPRPRPHAYRNRYMVLCTARLIDKFVCFLRFN